jgi:hypothetical protein
MCWRSKSWASLRVILSPAVAAKAADNPIKTSTAKDIFFIIVAPFKAKIPLDPRPNFIQGSLCNPALFLRREFMASPTVDF